MYIYILMAYLKKKMRMNKYEYLKNVAFIGKETKNLENQHIHLCMSFFFCTFAAQKCVE